MTTGRSCVTMAGFHCWPFVRFVGVEVLCSAHNLIDGLGGWKARTETTHSEWASPFEDNADFLSQGGLKPWPGFDGVREEVCLFCERSAYFGFLEICPLPYCALTYLQTHSKASCIQGAVQHLYLHR